MLRDGAKPALRTGRSRRVERGFLKDASIPWDQHLAVMFQIVSALVLYVPEAAAYVSKNYVVFRRTCYWPLNHGDTLIIPVY